MPGAVIGILRAILSANTVAFERGLKKSRRGLSGFVTEFAKVTAVLGVGTAVAKKFLDAQAKQIGAINELNRALAAQGNLLPGTSQRLQDHAAALQKVSTVGDEVILQNQAQLASFGMNEEQLKRATEVALDFSAATGRDLPQAMRLLGLAFSGETGQLKEMGIVIDQNLTGTQKYEAVIANLQGRFAGAAKAATQDFTGGMEQLGNAMGDTQEAAGKLIGAMADVTGSGQSGVKVFEFLSDLIGNKLVKALGWARAIFTQFLGIMINGLAKVVTVMADLARKLPGFMNVNAQALDNLAAEMIVFVQAQERAALGFIKQGDAAAAAAGKTQKFDNQLKKLGETSKDTAKSLKDIPDFLAEIRREAAIEQARALNRSMDRVRNLGTIYGKTRAEMRGVKDEAIHIEDATDDIVGETVNWHEALADVANQFTALGSAGGVLSQILGGVTAIGAGIDRWKTSGSGFSGVLAKIAAGGGILAAGVGLVKGIFGLFGGKSKEEKAREKAERDALLSESTSKLDELVGKLDEIRKKALEAGTSGLASMFANLVEGSDRSAARFERLGRLGLAVFSALRAEGMSTVEAIAAMGPALDAAAKAAEDAGIELTGVFAELVGFRQKVTDNAPLVSAAEALAGVFDALQTTGHLTQQTFDDLQAEAATAFDELITKGFTANEALALMAPFLLRAQQAAEKYGLSLDAGTQALVDQANQADLLEGLKTPQEEMIEIQQLMLQVLAELTKAFGATLPEAVQKYVDALNEIPKTVPSAPGVPPDLPGRGLPRFEHGGIIGSRGGLAMLDPHEAIVPLRDPPRAREILGAAGFGDFTFNLGDIVIHGDGGTDPRVLAEEFSRILEERTVPRFEQALRERVS